jgi:hypothetical protein
MTKLETPVMPLTGPQFRTTLTAIIAAALIVMGSFHSAFTGWNINTRMALVLAIVDRGTFVIDGYEAVGAPFETSDKALYEGHFYSDKVFGLSLFCVPLYAAMQAVARLFGFEWSLQALIYLFRLWSSSLPAALSLALLWTLMVRAGAAPRRALVAVALVFCGSLWFPYATLAMPYCLGILFCLAAMHVLLYPRSGTLRLRDAGAVGLFCGLSLISDFLFGLVVLAIVVAFLIRIWPMSMTGRLTLAAVGGLCGLVPLIAFFAYTYSIFGRLSIPYEFEALPRFQQGMQSGFMGITVPQFGRLWFLTLHPFRGVLFWSSWLCLAIVGCVLGIRRRGVPGIWGAMGLWAFASYLLTSASYYMWWGGGSMGARFTIPMLAVIPMGLVEICHRERRQLWRLFVVAGVLSTALCVPLALMNPQVGSEDPDEVIAAAQLSTPLKVPQLTALRRYYSGDWFWGADSRDHFLRILPLLAFGVAAMILTRSYRRLPS